MAAPSPAQLQEIIDLRKNTPNTGEFERKLQKLGYRPIGSSGKTAYAKRYGKWVVKCDYRAGDDAESMYRGYVALGKPKSLAAIYYAGQGIMVQERVKTFKDRWNMPPEAERVSRRLSDRGLSDVASYNMGWRMVKRKDGTKRKQWCSFDYDFDDE